MLKKIFIAMILLPLGYVLALCILIIGIDLIQYTSDILS